MATLGNVPAEAYTNTVKDSFSGNGSTTAFTMSLPTVTNDVRVVVENVIQDPTVAYSVSGTTLTFTSAPPSGTNNVYVVHLGPAVMTTVPPAEIADATTFASSLTVQGAFTSQGIDDNADAVAITIDSSENVLIGTTNANIYSTTTTGINLNPDGPTSFNRNGGQAAMFNRINSDGDIVQFRKDGSTVGSIGSYSGVGMYTMAPTNGGSGLLFYNNAAPIYPIQNVSGTATISNGVSDLGAAVHRFKDAYLSGGIYLGGTGAANKLEDYEEGTWTPTFPNGGTIGSVNSATYTKVGQLVFAGFYIGTISSIPSTSTDFVIGGLPFNVTAGNSYQAGGGVSYVNGANWASTNAMNTPLARVNTANFYFHRDDGNTNTVKSTDASVLNGQEMICSIIYQTSA